MTQQEFVNLGGSAFPTVIVDSLGVKKLFHPGMSLLDYFAAAALTGLLAQHDGDPTIDGLPATAPYWNPADIKDAEALAKQAYQAAGAMLLIRAKLAAESHAKGGAA